MKVLLLLFLLIASGSLAFGQKSSVWYRVYTFEDSRIEMNTSSVVLGGDIGRVTFRWAFDQPESLNEAPQLKYQTRLEVIEFRCSDNLYRIFEISFLNSTGKVVHSELMRAPYQWRPITGSVMTTIATPACELINRRSGLLDPKTRSNEEAELEKIADFAFSFDRSLKQSRDFRPLMAKFFAPNYLDGYLTDKETNWFLNLSRETATKASRAQLQRYYVAILNAAYLSATYLAGQSQSGKTDVDVSVAEEHLVPHDVLQMIKHHPYTATYKRNTEDYDFLAENIDSLKRMRSYSDLMEDIANLMRSHLGRVNAEQSRGYRSFLEDLDLDPQIRVCSTACLGLPKDTRLFEIKMPMFRVQLAKIEGQFKIVSVWDRSAKANH